MKIPKTSFCSISSPKPDVAKKARKTWLASVTLQKKPLKQTSFKTAVRSSDRGYHRAEVMAPESGSKQEVNVTFLR